MFVFPSVLFEFHFLLLSLILLVCKLDFKCAVTSKKLLFLKKLGHGDWYTPVILGLGK